MTSPTPAPAERRVPGPDDFPASGRNALGSIGQRGVARIIDTILVAVPAAVLMVPFLRIDDDELSLEAVPWWIVLVQLVLAVVYETVALRLWGRTLGKWLLGLRVARFGDGGNPTTAQAAQRIMLPQAVGAIPIGAAGALVVLVYLTSALDVLRRGIHDKYAGTIVIRTR